MEYPKQTSGNKSIKKDVNGKTPKFSSNGFQIPMYLHGKVIINDLKKENSLDLHLEEAWTGSVSL